MTPWAVVMAAAFGLSAFYALGRWHGEWRYRRTWEAGYRSGYRAAVGDIARSTGRRPHPHRNERDWPGNRRGRIPMPEPIAQHR